MDTLTLTREVAQTADVRALLERHFALMRGQSPEESCHVMTADSLTDAAAQLLGVRKGGALLGIAALVVIAPEHGELKSMHIVKEARGQGIARRLLCGLIDTARAQNLRRLSLETGTADIFSSARALYQSQGFRECPPFGEYVADPLSVFMTKALNI